MDIKKLLETMDSMQAAEKHPVGPKFKGYWKGSDKNPPKPGMGVGGLEQESILKDLGKGKTPKTREQELSEEFEAFLQALEEENLGTHPKRPGRTSDRHARGHEPEPRYKTIKTDENSMSEKDIELQDYRSMSHKEFQTAYGMTKTEWINKNKALVIQNPSIKKALGLDEAGSPAQQAAIAIAMKKASKKPKNEGAEQDPIVARVVKQMRPGLTGLDMGNEAFLYFAYELGKQRARDAWEDYLPAIRAEYEKGLAESSYYGPVEARWMVKLSDDEGDHLKTYHDKFTSLSAAKKAYKNTPYATDFKYKPVKKEQVDEATDSDIVQAMGQDSFNRAGYNPLRDERDYLDTLSKLRNLALKPGLDQTMKDHIAQRINDLNAEARKKGFIQAESRGHTVIANKLKDVERAKKFASGELKVPTPQERQAQLKKLEKAKPVKEYGADQPTGTAAPGSATQQNTIPTASDPKAQQQAQNITQATNALKAATGTTAPAPNIIKALNTAMQGKSIGGTDAKTLEPMMDVIGQAAQDPKVAQQFKSLAQSAKQSQMQQKKV
jgi:hypothetical protein